MSFLFQQVDLIVTFNMDQTQTSAACLVFQAAPSVLPCVAILYLPRQVLQDRLQLVAQQFDQPTLDVAVGHVDHENVGGGVRQLVILQEKEGGRKKKVSILQSQSLLVRTLGVCEGEY